MDSMKTVMLAAGALELEVSPSIGGSISSFEWIGDGRRVAILRKCHTGLQNVLDAASFPLVPFVNRVRGGRFAFRDREVRLAPNMPGDPSPLHGQGWLGEWQVERNLGSAA
jgi:aldose 1-epimerase